MNDKAPHQKKPFQQDTEALRAGVFPDERLLGIDVWSPGCIGSVCLKNRFIRSAVNDAQAELNGGCTLIQAALMRELAVGGAGAIISGHIYVHNSGRAGNRQMGLDKDTLIPGLARMVHAVHEADGVFFAQLSHAGSQADIYLTGQPAAGPSARLSPEGPMTCSMSADDIDTIVQAFAQAAVRARTAGFDGIQIHGAHGYCLSEFLSPRFNRRTDQYGGSVANRARIVLEVCRAVRAAVGREYPLLLKINSEDSHDNGMTRAMMRETVGLLSGEDLLDAVEISGFGGTLMAPRAVDMSNSGSEAYARDAAVEFKKELNIPVILVGGIRSLNAARYLVSHGETDFVAMARPFIRDPGLIAKWWRQDNNSQAKP